MRQKSEKMHLIVVVLVLLQAQSDLALKEQGPAVSCSDEKKKLLCLPEEYSKFDLPYRNEFNVIDIGIEISDVLKIDDKDYSITFSLYFNVQWSEPRLNLSQEFFNSENISSEDHLVPVNLELIHDLWLPNIFIYNLKTFKVIDVLSKLAGLWINSKKEIYYSQATHITFICPMLFDSFPLDTQVCKFQVGSYSYDMRKMLFRVSQLTFIQKQSIILDYNIQILNLKQSDKIFLAGPLGNYSLAGFQMNLRRHVMSYIITYYLPSGLFVVVSWISFLIPPDIVPGRMALLITLFLVLINIFNNITTNSPKAEGLTAIEIWMLACILFVFGTLIEYAVILFKKQKKCKYVTVNNHSSCKNSGGYGRPQRETSVLHETSNGEYLYDSNYPGELPRSSSPFETAHSLYKYDPVSSTLRQVFLPLQHVLPEMQQARNCSRSPAELNEQRLQATPTNIAVGNGDDSPPPNLNAVLASSVGEEERFITTPQPTTTNNAHNKTPINFVYQKDSSKCNPRRIMDSLKRKRNRRQSILDKHYSTWHDQYAGVDRFFLYFTPFLFLVFNSIYWGYFYVWGLIVSNREMDGAAIEMPKVP